VDQLPGTANYFIGNDPAKWRTSVPTYAKVKYAGIYPGIDLAYYGNQRQLEYDFIVAPGASPKPIRLQFAENHKASSKQRWRLDRFSSEWRDRVSQARRLSSERRQAPAD
jgi:hypothetical protein